MPEVLDWYRCGHNSRVNDGSEVVTRRKRAPGERWVRFVFYRRISLAFSIAPTQFTPLLSPTHFWEIAPSLPLYLAVARLAWAG
jgi:hypothetical protein